MERVLEFKITINFWNKVCNTSKKHYLCRKNNIHI